MSGEAMAALWGAVKSVVGSGDRVVCLSNGLYGTGFAGMARSAGAAETVLVESDWRGRLDLVRLEKELVARRTRMVTAVHCETPSGVLTERADACWSDGGVVVWCWQTTDRRCAGSRRHVAAGRPVGILASPHFRSGTRVDAIGPSWP